MSKKSVAWLKENKVDMISKEIWPPSSPDVNPMDYFFWGVLESQTNKAAHTTKTSLMAQIKKEAMNMENSMVRAACGRFRGCVEAVIAAEGDFIEKMHSIHMWFVHIFEIFQINEILLI